MDILFENILAAIVLLASLYLIFRWWKVCAELYSVSSDEFYHNANILAQDPNTPKEFLQFVTVGARVAKSRILPWEFMWTEVLGFRRLPNDRKAELEEQLIAFKGTLPEPLDKVFSKMMNGLAGMVVSRNPIVFLFAFVSSAMSFLANQKRFVTSGSLNGNGDKPVQGITKPSVIFGIANRHDGAKAA